MNDQDLGRSLRPIITDEIKEKCVLNSTDVASSFHFCIKLSAGALYIPLIPTVVFCDQCWQTVRAGVSATSGSTLVSAKVAGICRVRLPSKLFTKIMRTFRSLKELESFQPFSGLANFRYIADLATKARLANEFQPVFCSALQRLCEASHKYLGHLRASTKSFKSWSAEPGLLRFLQE